jgi:hypothetical protein
VTGWQKGIDIISEYDNLFLKNALDLELRKPHIVNMTRWVLEPLANSYFELAEEEGRGPSM